MAFEYETWDDIVDKIVTNNFTPRDRFQEGHVASTATARSIVDFNVDPARTPHGLAGAPDNIDVDSWEQSIPGSLSLPNTIVNSMGGSQKNLNQIVVIPSNGKPTTWTMPDSAMPSIMEQLSLLKLQQVEHERQSNSKAHTMSTVMNKSMTAKSKASSLFKDILALPRELRDMIWKAKLNSPNPPKFIVVAGSFPSLPAICYTNRQIFQECVPIYLEDKQVRLIGWRIFKTFNNLLVSIPRNRGYLSITSLRIENDHNWGYDRPDTLATPYSLIKRCPNICHIGIHVSALESLLSINRVRSGKNAFSRCRKEEVIETTAPKRLFSLEHLTDILLVISETKKVAELVRCTEHEVTMHLLDRMEEEKKRTGSKARLEVRYVAYFDDEGNPCDTSS